MDTALGTLISYLDIHLAEHKHKHKHSRACIIKTRYQSLQIYQIKLKSYQLAQSIDINKPLDTQLRTGKVSPANKWEQG